MWRYYGQQLRINIDELLLKLMFTDFNMVKTRAQEAFEYLVSLAIVLNIVHYKGL